MSGARCPVQSSEERTATNYKWVGRGEEGCRMDSIKELRSCQKTGASTGELEHIASSLAEAEWSLPITWADAHRFPQPTCISFCWFLFFFFKHGWRWNPGTPTCQASALPLTYSPSSKHLYFQSSLDEADAAKKVSHAVRSADSIYCGPHGCMPSTGSGSGMEEDTDPVCLSRSLCRASGKLCFWEKTVEMKHTDSRLLPEI